MIKQNREERRTRNIDRAQETAGASGENPGKKGESRTRGTAAVPAPASAPPRRAPLMLLTAGMRSDFCVVRSIGDSPRCTHTRVLNGAMTCPRVGSLVADHLAQGGNTAASFFSPLCEPAAFRSLPAPTRENNERRSAKGRRDTAIILRS